MQKNAEKQKITRFLCEYITLSGNFLLFYSRSADSPSPGLSKILSAAYNFGTCFLELPAIVLWVMYI